MSLQPRREYTTQVLLRLKPEQAKRWRANAEEAGLSVSEYIRSGVELLEDGQDAPHQTALDLLQRLVANTRGRRRKAWQRAEQALRAAIQEAT